MGLAQNHGDGWKKAFRNLTNTANCNAVQNLQNIMKINTESSWKLKIS